MKHVWPKIALLASLAAAGLSACGAPASETGATANGAGLASATTVSAPTLEPLPVATQAPESNIELSISGVGEVKAERDADLTFGIQGTIAEVKVKEGDTVKQGDLLAILDTRTLDQQVKQAQAGLASAEAAQAGLREPPRAADVRAAKAQVAQAQAALDQVRAGAKSQDLQTAQAGVTSAEASLQSTKDRLSLAKTQAQIQMDQATQTLTQAQARYAQAKAYWEHVQDSGTDPVAPEVSDGKGGKVPNRVSDGQRENYYQQFISAEAALRQAEQAVELAKAAYDTARQSEVTGINGAEQQLVQARASLDKLKAGADKSQLTAAQASLAAAQANQARLNPNPTKAQQAQASAGVAQATSALELARINRERAELRAPFDGVVAVVNIDPGDPTPTGNQSAMRVVDVSKLHVDVQISDVDIAKVKVGQKAAVRADALPETTFSGSVTYIAPTTTTSGTLRTYLVRITLDKQDDLRAGMSVRVDITPAKTK